MNAKTRRANIAPDPTRSEVRAARRRIRREGKIASRVALFSY